MSERPRRPFCPYSARVLEPISNGPGRWNSLRIGVFQHTLTPSTSPGETPVVTEEQIGEYVRNYSSYGVSTFEPFLAADGRMYALASRHYTCTEILKLPECEWIGGETPESFGFCPVDLYVPRYFDAPHTHADGRPFTVRMYDYEYQDPEVTENDLGLLTKPGWRTYPFGFVAGCVWGDDSSWKIQAFDLREAHLGKLTRLAPWGYVEMGGDSLIDSVRYLNEWGDKENDLSFVRLKTLQTFDASTKRKSAT